MARYVDFKLLHENPDRGRDSRYVEPRAHYQ